MRTEQGAGWGKKQQALPLLYGGHVGLYSVRIMKNWAEVSGDDFSGASSRGDASQ